jgi:uncharacterized protein (DUF433 family)
MGGSLSLRTSSIRYIVLVPGVCSGSEAVEGMRGTVHNFALFFAKVQVD